MTGTHKKLLLVLGVVAVSATGFAQYFSQEYEDARRYYGIRHYSGYPYHWSLGLRYDPYWSYNSSYFPQTYDGDGSYYGLGYSGCSGGGWYGSYYYW